MECTLLIVLVQKVMFLVQFVKLVDFLVKHRLLEIELHLDMIEEHFHIFQRMIMVQSVEVLL